MTQKLLIALLMASCVVIGILWAQLNSTPVVAQSVGDDSYFPFQLVNVQDLTVTDESDLMTGQFMIFDRETGELSFLDASIRDRIRPMGDLYSIVSDDRGGAYILNKQMGATWRVQRESNRSRLKLLPFLSEE